MRKAVVVVILLRLASSSMLCTGYFKEKVPTVGPGAPLILRVDVNAARTLRLTIIQFLITRLLVSKHS